MGKTNLEYVAASLKESYHIRLNLETHDRNDDDETTPCKNDDNDNTNVRDHSILSSLIDVYVYIETKV